MKKFDSILIGLIIGLIIILIWMAPEKYTGSFSADPDIAVNLSKNSIRGLCVSSGGLKGYAFVGALQVLEDRGMDFSSLTHLAGCSAGSLICGFLACGLTLSDIKQVIKKTNTYEIFKKRKPELISQTFENAIAKKCPPSITFAELRARGKYLIIPATRLSSVYPFLSCEYYTPDTSPNMKISEAVMHSSNIPFVLTTKLNLTDGGMSDPYPIRFLQNYLPLSSIIGIRLDWSNELNDHSTALKIKHKLSISPGSWANKLDSNFLTQSEKSRTIPIENHSLKMVIVNQEDINKTLLEGEKYAERFLSGHEYYY